MLPSYTLMQASAVGCSAKIILNFSPSWPGNSTKKMAYALLKSSRMDPRALEASWFKS